MMEERHGASPCWLGDILHLPAVMLLDQRVVECHRFAVAELLLELGPVVHQDRRG